MSLSFKDSPSRTKQSFKDECDINQIMKRWRKTGEMQHLNERNPTYGDFTNPNDYLAAKLHVQAADEDFNTLSARIRSRFNNDPAELLSFMGDSTNEPEAIELGLIPKPASTPPVPPRGIQPLEPAPAETATPPEVPTASPISGGE